MLQVKNETENQMIKLTILLFQILVFCICILVTLYFLRPQNVRSRVLCIFCIFLFSLISRQIVQITPSIKDEVILTAQNAKREESNGTEVDIVSLMIDGVFVSPFDAEDGHWYWVSNRYSWRPSDDKRWDGTATNQITLKVPVGWERYINFDENIYRGYVEVKRPDGVTEIVDTYSQEKLFFPYFIGRSETKLLILNGILQISIYAASFFSMTAILVLAARHIGSVDSVMTSGENKKLKVQKCQTYQFKSQIIKSIIAACLLGILIILFVLSNLWGRIKTDAQIMAFKPEVISEPITLENRYTQTFSANGTFNQIQLQFATFDRKNLRTTNVQLKNIMTKDIVNNWELDNSNITKDIVKLNLPQNCSKGQYELIISSNNSDSESCVGIYLQDKSIYNGKLHINGEFQNHDISIGLVQETHLGHLLLIGILSAAIICFWIAYLVLYVFRMDLWKAAFILIMSFGSLYLFIYPSGAVNDSWRHYLTAYDYSNAIFGIPKSSFGTVLMRKDDCDAFLRYRGINRNASIELYFEEFDEFSIRCQDKTIADCGIRSLDYGSTSAASKIAYFPQTLGLTIGRFLSLGTVPCMFLARLLQLFVVATLLSLSIKIIPSRREMFLLVALLPIFLQQIAAFSYDGMAFGFSFLFISICTKLNSATEKISLSDLIFLLFSTIGLCACRGGIYIVTCIILLLVPGQVLSIFQKLCTLGIGIITVFAFYGKPYFSMTSTASNGGNLIYGSPFQHPIKVGLHFISSVIENIDLYWGGLLGEQMGWSQGSVPYFLAFGFAIMLMIVSLSEDTSIHQLDKRSRFIYICPVILVLGICLCTMYLGESERATKWNIWGVQGRYLIPVLPLAFFQIQNQWVVLKKNIRPAIMTIFCAWEVVEIFYLMRAYLIR